jgi:hypothetical protein
MEGFRTLIEVIGSLNTISAGLLFFAALGYFIPVSLKKRSNAEFNFVEKSLQSAPVTAIIIALLMPFLVDDNMRIAIGASPAAPRIPPETLVNMAAVSFFAHNSLTPFCFMFIADVIQKTGLSVSLKLQAAFWALSMVLGIWGVVRSAYQFEHLQVVEQYGILLGKDTGPKDMYSVMVLAIICIGLVITGAFVWRKFGVKRMFICQLVLLIAQGACAANRQVQLAVGNILEILWFASILWMEHFMLHRMNLQSVGDGRDTDAGVQYTEQEQMHWR